MASEADYEAYRKQERGLTDLDRLQLWTALPKEVQDDFRRFAHRREMRRALWRYTFGVLGVAAAVLGGIACLVVADILGPRHSIGVLVLAGGLLVMLGWIPGAQMASSAKSELVDRA
jgi:hypothetical protein